MDLPHHATEERDDITMRTLTAVRQYLAAASLLVIGLVAYGCGDSATVNPEATLANLTVTIGTDTATLNPAFNPATTSYTVELLNNVTTVTVSAQPAVAGDNVTIDGQAATSRVIDLGPSVPAGSTTLVSITVSDLPNTPRTYTILLRRAPLDGNNSLRSLTVTPGTLNPEFAAVREDYRVDVLSSVGSIAITPTLDDANATMTVNGQAATSGQARSITLNGPSSSTPIDVVVTAQNNTTKTYTVLVNRGGLSGNNNLGSLTVSPGSLTPSFNPNLQSYTVNVVNTVGSVSVSVTPTRQNPNAPITVNGTPATSGQGRAVNLNPPGQATIIQIEVTAQNGDKRPYFVTVNRGISNNTNLQNLAISPGALAPTFNANTPIYTVNVGNAVGSVSVTPTRQDSSATITVNGQATNSGQAQTITLNGAGSNTLINIVVTAQNSTQKIYTVNVARAALGGNNNLLALTVSPGPLTPAFAAATTNYTVDVGSTVTSVSVTPTRQDPNATITVNGTPATSGQGRSITLNGAGSNTSINILVTAPNGSQKSYTITVERAALGGNNNLSALTVSPGSFDSPFNANDLSYTVEVGSSVSSITVTPTRQDPNATITVNGTPATSGQGRTITLNGAGSNTLINIVVTAPNGSQKSYTITVERAALGGNNNLSGLTVSPGTLSPAFTAARTAYTVNAGSSDTSITVTATPQDPSATVTINGQGGNSRSIPLPGGPSSTEIEVLVIAPNGTDKTHLITINQPAPSAPPAPTVAPDLTAEDDSCEPGIPDPAVCAPGTSKDDNVTNVPAPSFTVAQPAAGETPTLYVDGSIAKQGFDSGANTLTPTAALSDGVHTITSTVTNAGGLESPKSPSLTVTIDTVAPGGQ